MKDGAFADLRLGPDAATVTPYDPLHSGQTDPSPFKFLRAMKASEGESDSVLPQQKNSFAADEDWAHLDKRRIAWPSIRILVEYYENGW